MTESNAASVISSTVQLTLSDVVSPATFQAQSGTAGSYGTFAIDASGAWTYAASSAHNEFAGGQTYTDSFGVLSADGTSTSVSITITGTNDAAVLSSDARHLTETNAASDITNTSQLTITDVDIPASFQAQSGTAGSYGSLPDALPISWTYAASSAHNEFAGGQTYTDSFGVLSADGTSTSVSITITGTNDAAVLSSDARHLTETNAASDISSTGQLKIGRAHV